MNERLTNLMHWPMVLIHWWTAVSVVLGVLGTGFLVVASIASRIEQVSNIDPIEEMELVTLSVGVAIVTWLFIWGVEVVTIMLTPDRAMPEPILALSSKEANPT